ncbi:hypothetical protein GGI06_002092 [Coemansia sp. S85]|nr:hypothetical protein GGI06_002092 [Coemansia sp. S85]
MTVFNFYVWYDSSRINILEDGVDAAYDIGATFFNYGCMWGYAGGYNYESIIELQNLATCYRSELTMSINVSESGEECQPVAEHPEYTEYLEAQPKQLMDLTDIDEAADTLDDYVSPALLE